MTYRIENKVIIREYTTDDGGEGLHCIPVEAVATRMVLLGLESPGQALEAIVAEQDLARDQNPYGPVYAALGTGSDPHRAQVEALQILPTQIGPDTRDDVAFKEFISQEFEAELRAVMQGFLSEVLPPDLLHVAAQRS